MLERTLALALVLGMVPAVAPAEEKLAFEAEGWELSGTDSKIEPHLGQQSLRLRTGRAIRRDVRLRDGTIEFDVTVTERRAFAYIQFRMQSDGEYEAIWFRTHKSGGPDAIQYSPIYQGAASWQIYHGPGYTGSAQLPPGEWIHVKLVLSGRRAALFVGPGDEPALVVPRLAREPLPGYIGLRSLLPGGGAPEGVYAASYANLVVRPGESDFDFSRYPASEASPRGVVQKWAVSPAFVPAEGAVRELPRDFPEPASWSLADAEPSGIVVLQRYVAIPEGMRRTAALARVIVRATEPGTRRFNLGFANEASVFLNGQLLYSGNNRYSYNFPRRQGLVTLDQASLYLPLRAGENELVVAVRTLFGGWGLIGQFEDPRGLEVVTRE